ncbi:MAG: nucleotide exchange factor GrpE [Oscillospiraceae bacterium]|jgi:molecular chaperone GrpE|nr:nucleotide exchange factor GrpE [Oscillospiraceae bacterium]
MPQDKETNDRENTVRDSAAPDSEADAQLGAEGASPAECAGEAVEPEPAGGETLDINSVESLRTLLEEAVAKQDEYLEFAKRERADFENYKRRTRSESLEQYDSGRAKVIEDMLPVVDSLEFAVASAKDDDTRQGVQLVVKQMNGLFEKWGVSPIDRPGEPFDPQIEHAVMRGEANEGSPGLVLQVLRKGYKMGSRVLRPAMVKVGSE